MEVLYLLVPMSAGLVLVVLGVFGWAVYRGQFDDVEREGARMLEGDPDPLGVAVHRATASPQANRNRDCSKEE